MAVALSAVMGVAFRRSRKAIMRLLHIDPDANRIVEPAVARMAAADKPRADAEARATLGGMAAGTTRAVQPGERLPWHRRLVVALVVVAFVVLTYFVVAPVELLAGNAGDLVFGLATAWPVILRAALALLAVCTLLLSVFRGRVFDVLLALACAVGLAAYLQVMFMNGGLPITNGSLVNWVEHRSAMLVSTVVWLAVIVAAVVLALHRPRASRAASVAVSLVLVLVQAVGLVSIWTSDATRPAESSQLNAYTEEGMLDVSDRSNVVVIVLDMTDTGEVRGVYQDNPEMFDALDGFTWYQNSVGSMAPTRYGCSYLLTGQLPQDGEDFQSYLGRSLAPGNFVDDVAAQGYDLGIYSDSGSVSHAYRDAFAGKAFNVHPLVGSGLDNFDERGTLKILLKTSLYRDLPWAFKPYFWYYTDEINKGMTVPLDQQNDLASVPYTFDDPAFHARLEARGLSVEDRGQKGSFRFIHLLGAHFPYVMDANAAPVVGETTYDQQLLGSFKIVSEYLQQLKDLGVYDQTTVIVTADHGRIDFMKPEDGPITRPTSPILMVKPAHAAHGPMTIDATTPVWTPDVLATALDQMGADQATVAKYGTPVYALADDPARERYFDAPTWDGNYTVDMYQFKVAGPVEDWRSWELTGTSWKTNER